MTTIPIPPDANLRERLIAAKLAGTTIPNLITDQSSVHRYRFRSNEQAADIAQREVAAWLRDKAAVLMKASEVLVFEAYNDTVASAVYLRELVDEIDPPKGDET